MDVKKIKILKEKAKDKSILIVEDCNVLQKQMYIFLLKFFKDVHQAFDGNEGVEKFKEVHPDIVLTDLSMPKKSGLDMIKEIKYINNNTKIIILSAHNEEDILMDVIKLNVEKFLLKPLNIDIFIDSLLNILGGDKLNKYTECIHDLEILHHQKGHVRLVNYFKNTIIEQEGEIVKINNDIISIKIPHTQILAIDNEGNTTLELKSIHKFMKFRLLNIDKEDDIIHLSRPMYVEYSLRYNTHKRYFYNRKFAIGLHDKHHYFSLDVLDVVSDSITMYIDSTKTDLVMLDSVNLTITLIFDDSSKNKDIFVRSKITSISRYKKGLRVIATMNVDKKDLLDFKKYLRKIEDEIIKELRGE
jgi:DNA-binding NarL/FixJ family response regulator